MDMELGGARCADGKRHAAPGVRAADANAATTTAPEANGEDPDKAALKAMAETALALMGAGAGVTFYLPTVSEACFCRWRHWPRRREP